MTISIAVNKPDLTYIAGETLHGTVTIANPSEEKVRSVYILVSGVAEVEWTVSTSYKDSQGHTRHRTTRYYSEEKYLNSQTVLFGEIGGPTVKYPPGTHTYNFACVLPDRLPGTIKTTEAEIKYKVKVVMDIPWGIDITNSLGFVVTNVVDLNQNTALKIPTQVEEVKSFCCSDNALISATIPQGGYVPNENIPILCTIDNKTKIPFNAITFELQRKVAATAIHPHTTTRESKYTEARNEYIFRADEETRNASVKVTGNLKVPVCPVSSHFAAYIKTNYFLKVEFIIDGCHTNVTLRLPVEIGTIPLGAPGYEHGGMVPLAPMPQVPLAPMPPMPMIPPMPAGHMNMGPMPSAPMPNADSEKMVAQEQPPPSYAEVTQTNEKEAEASESDGIGWKVQ